jgi:cyclomaltodextrinase
MSRKLIRVLVVSVAVVAALSAPLAAQGSPLKRVTFTFTPNRHFDRVFLAGTFNGWSTDATEMSREAGVFDATLPLAVGEYQYKFVADGEWITDEKAKRFLPDGYGGRNSVIDVDDSYEDMALARGDGDILLDGLAHRQDAWERSLNEDGTVTIRARAWHGDVAEVDLVWWVPSGAGGVAGTPPSGSEGTEKMTLFDTDGRFDYYESVLDQPEFDYVFHVRDGGAAATVSADGVEEGIVEDARPFFFDADEESVFRTPDWVKKGVIYQIFPERFSNGNPGNDPDFSEWYYEGLTTLPPSGHTNGEYFHMVDDWYDVSGLTRSPYKTDGKPDWNSFYGGDIEGVRAHLDYLQDLGVTIIYFNPVFEAKSNHKYDAATYQRIDPHFGTNEEFTQFVEDCHGRGIHVVIDLAINHTGHTHWAFVDAREEGETSDYWDWYEFKKWPVPGSPVYTPPDPLTYYDCWWGFGQMPNLNYDLSRANAEEQSVVGIDEAEPNWPLVNHLLDTAEYWLSEVGVDGYRLDVAAEVPFWFWELFRERVRHAKPDAYIVGELWGASPEWVNGKYFDAVMNYKFFRDPVHRFIAHGQCDAPEFDRMLAEGRLIYPDEGVRAQMNLLDSHDTERFLTTVGGDLRRLKLATLFAMTYVGAPSIYYGDEIAMEGGHDPDCRRPFLWNWTDDAARVETHDYFAKLANLRMSRDCMTLGSYRTLFAEGPVFAFLRSLGDEHVVVVLNAGDESATVSVPLGDEIRRNLADDGATVAEGALLRDLLTDETLPIDGGNGAAVTLELPAVSGSIYEPVPAQ